LVLFIKKKEHFLISFQPRSGLFGISIHSASERDANGKIVLDFSSNSESFRIFVRNDRPQLSFRVKFEELNEKSK